MMKGYTDKEMRAEGQVWDWPPKFTPRLIKNFITDERAKQEADLMDWASKNCPGDFKDGQVDGAESWYGIHWELLEDCTEQCSELLGYELLPAYTYTRLYQRGNVMYPHRDRQSCEFNVTINLRNIGGTWDFYWFDEEDVEHPITMHPGDAVLYDGHATKHYRKPCEVDNVYQCFLHYVDANGKYANRANEYMTKRNFIKLSLQREKNLV
jgi:hypothetical protein